MSYRISPNSLRTFEAAARHSNFTIAAREVHSTQSAVSQTVRGLEEQLGCRLFERVYRGVRLTEAGATLFESVREGFATIDRGIEQLRSSSRQPHLKIFTDFAFAAYWLLPRLPLFRRMYPHINVQIVTDQGVADWQHQDVDVAIAFCDEQQLGQVPCLVGETVLPVCSPSFIDRYGPIDDFQALSTAPLLALTVDEDPKWLNWPRFFMQQAELSSAVPAELTFNNYTLLVQAAVAGHGVGLGWKQLVGGALRDNMLVGLDHMCVSTRCGYGLIDVRPEQDSDEKNALYRWLVDARTNQKSVFGAR